MASGVLLVLVGEATKLGSYLTGHDKEYIARILFGVATDTLDGTGRVVAQVEVPSWLLDEMRRGGGDGRLAAAIEAERRRSIQVPPTFSAIHVAGRRSYELARQGRPVELAARAVRVAALAPLMAGGETFPAPNVDLRLVVSKGYYVRALARDLGEQLAVPAHLAGLRRVSSGPFSIEAALPVEDLSSVTARALIPLAEAAARSLPVGRLTAAGVTRVRHGQTVTLADFDEPPPVAEASAWLDTMGRLVAVGQRRTAATAPTPDDGEDCVFAIHRGFVR
jgi:tRNA pseudouridine55 synthase